MACGSVCSAINFVFLPQCSHSKVRISPTKPAGSGECQTARAFSPQRGQAIGLMWTVGIYVNALRRTGIVLFRIRKSLTGRRPLSAFRQSDNPALILSKKMDFCDCRHRAANKASLFSASWLRGRKPWKSSKGRQLPNLSAVVMTFAAGHRHKSDKYLGAVLRSKNHKQSQPQSPTGE